MTTALRNRSTKRIYNSKKSKLVTSGSKLNEIREIGKRMENSVSSFFINQKKIVEVEV